MSQRCSKRVRKADSEKQGRGALWQRAGGAQSYSYFVTPSNSLLFLATGIGYDTSEERLTSYCNETATYNWITEVL